MKKNTILRKSVFSIDVEDWFHVLDSPAVPGIERWFSLESRIEKNLDRLLEMLDNFSVRATFFWLGWSAEHNKDIVRKCCKAGHEIASHGYGHVLAYKVGRRAFAEDIHRAKAVLEDISGEKVTGFRAAGFSTKDDTPWAFEEIRAAGHTYDSSVFPASRSHGGMPRSLLGPHIIKTESGDLVELPQSMIEIFGKRITFFGGGYLRLAPKPLIKWGIRKLRKAGQPSIVYVHPREIDPAHPRLPLSLIRHFKCYVNLKSTMPKLQWLCQECKFCTMRELVAEFHNPQTPEKVAEKSRKDTLVNTDIQFVKCGSLPQRSASHPNQKNVPFTENESSNANIYDISLYP